MKLKFLIFSLIISLATQAQIHQRIHQNDKTLIGIPIADIDSITNVGGTKTIRYKNATSETFLINTVDSITHAVPVSNNLYNVISGDANLSQLKSGSDLGGLNPYPLGLSGNMTVFAPTNNGLSGYGISPSTLTADDNEILFSYHIIQGKFNIADIPVEKNRKYYTMNQPADSVFVTKFVSPTSGNTFVFINGVQINNTTGNVNIPASNGVLHKLTNSYGVLFPPFRNIYDEINKTQYSATAFRYDSIAKLVARAALADASIINTLKSNILTLITPSNAAFTTFLQSVPAYGGSINNITPANALSLLKDHMVVGRQFLSDFQIAGTTGLPAYGGGSLKWGNAGTSTAPNYVFYYTTGARMVDYDYMQINGVIHQINDILIK